MLGTEAARHLLVRKTYFQSSLSSNHNNDFKWDSDSAAPGDLR